MPWKDPAKKLESQRSRRQRIREVIAHCKDQPCDDCGEIYPGYVMDFDHVRGEKLGNISSDAQANYWSEQRLFDEIAKCDVVCANCHRIRTHKKRDAEPGT